MENKPGVKSKDGYTRATLSKEPIIISLFPTINGSGFQESTILHLNRIQNVISMGSQSMKLMGKSCIHVIQRSLRRQLSKLAASTLL